MTINSGINDIQIRKLAKNIGDSLMPDAGAFKIIPYVADFMANGDLTNVPEHP